jgi:hypothetical protein
MVDETALTKLKDMRDSLEYNLQTSHDINLVLQQGLRTFNRLPRLPIAAMHGSGDGLDDERDLKPTPIADSDAAYDDGNKDDNAWDLGIRLASSKIWSRLARS